MPQNSDWTGFKAPGSYGFPFVTNADGGQSNVRLASSEADGRHYVFPTMMGGKQYSMDDAWNEIFAPNISGLPWFASELDAEDWIQRNHNRIGANGVWNR